MWRRGFSATANFPRRLAAVAKAAVTCASSTRSRSAPSSLSMPYISPNASAPTIGFAEGILASGSDPPY
jgi:hypothetical protein